MKFPLFRNPYKLHHADGECSGLAESVAASDHFVVLADLMGNVHCYNEEGNFRPVLELPGRRVSDAIVLQIRYFGWRFFSRLIVRVVDRSVLKGFIQAISPKLIILHSHTVCTFEISGYL